MVITTCLKNAVAREGWKEAAPSSGIVALKDFLNRWIGPDMSYRIEIPRKGIQFFTFLRNVHITRRGQKITPAGLLKEYGV
jgi:hypothetical protein